MRSLVLVLSMVVAGAGCAASQAPDLAADSAVRIVVGQYLHGLKFNDVASLREAFWPDAKLFWVRQDGQIGQLTQADWYRGFAASAGKKETGELRITSVDVTGTAAAVKVVEDYPRSRYTDYLSLLRLGGRWWIVHKIYTAERR